MEIPEYLYLAFRPSVAYLRHQPIGEGNTSSVGKAAHQVSTHNKYDCT